MTLLLGQLPSLIYSFRFNLIFFGFTQETLDILGDSLSTHLHLFVRTVIVRVPMKQMSAFDIILCTVNEVLAVFLD